MKLFKIIFEENRPIAASPQEYSHLPSVCIEKEAGRRCIRWITTFAHDEQDGLKIAHEVVSNLYSFL